ncbi:hypothetical protein GCM10009557_15450 [Virgisporangium ochraceum]|uniref:Uncharacterized protein n=1 Tax=Virgisporangium ochraceum TaxID=65505 RepID=A0A8J3ZPD7_9ACTN|nr:hypothetical protein Voc01_028560 [Virgisporangium ochraceum]
MFRKWLERRNWITIRAWLALGVVALGVDLAVLMVLGLTSGPVITAISVLATLIGAAMALVENKRLVRGARRWPLVAGAIVCTVIPVGIAFAFAADELKSPGLQVLTDESIVEAATICKESDCRVVDRIRMGDGTNEYTVGVFEKFEVPQGGEAKFPGGVGVVVLLSDGQIIWRSEFLPGYGLAKLATDVSQNAFISFNLSNHSSLGWVIGLRSGQFTEYGTVNGRLRIDNFSDQSYNGLRHLFTYRVGWPANESAGALRDVWNWDGSEYRYDGCETRDGSASWSPVSTAGVCPSPLGKHSFDLPG